MWLKKNMFTVGSLDFALYPELPEAYILMQVSH